jgi:excisionase family DNA binding protein
MTDVRLLTVAEAAELLRVHPRTIRRWIRAGKLRAQTIPGRGSHGIGYRIEQRALWTFLNQEGPEEQARDMRQTT